MNTTKTKDYHARISVAHTTAKQAFDCINNPKVWWGGNIEGSSVKLNDEFIYKPNETWVKFKLTEFVPNQKVVWYATDCNLPWLKDKKEWKDTRVVWNITEDKNGAKIEMVHEGLVPEVECYDNCEKGWDFYIKTSLLNLLTSGKGMPDTPGEKRK